MSKKENEKVVQMTPDDIAQTETVQEGTVEIIDAYMTEFCVFLEDKNVGELRGIRSLLERKMLEADHLGGNILKSSKVTQFDEKQRTQLAQVFTVVAKISDKIGYIDYLLEKRKINFEKE